MLIGWQWCSLYQERHVNEAADKGLFHFYPVSCVDQALELLMNLPAARLKKIAEMYGHKSELSYAARAGD